MTSKSHLVDLAEENTSVFFLTLRLKAIIYHNARNNYKN